MSIRTVNLLWEKRIRQTYSVAPYGVRDDGAVMLAVPRPLEARAYDRTLLLPDGATETRSGFSVETLLKLELSWQADNGMGMTSDDIYLFREGGKERFMGERHQLYVDAVLSEAGQHLFTAFSDMSGTSYALAYGAIKGHVDWTMEIEGCLTTVAISRQGNRVVAGVEHGVVLLKDASRREVWEFGVGEAVSALACSRDGVWVAYGTREGGVGLVDGDGTRKWEATLPGEIVKLALSGDGTICAALCRPRQDPNNVLLACIGATGQVDWQYASEQMLTGLSLSDNGQYMATGTRNGTTAVYKVVVGEGAPAGAMQTGGRALSQAQELAQAGDLRGAVRILEIALLADPASVELYEAWSGQRETWLVSALHTAQTQAEQGDAVGAMNALENLLREEPLRPEVATALAEVTKQRVRQVHEQAQALIAQEQEDLAEAALLDALRVSPLDSLEIRVQLGNLRSRRSGAADALADALLADGKLEEGVAALERAQSVNPTPERAQKLLRAQTAMEFGAGMAAYNAKEYREAIFQFKKVLARDPQHAEANRYLGFAQRFSQDTSNETLNDRFRRLE